MSSSYDDTFGGFRPSRAVLTTIKRLAVLWGVVMVVGLVVLLILWNTFFKYVPPGKNLVVIAKNGAPLPSGEVLADSGQKGVLRAVKGEGWHFITPVIYTTELEDNVVIRPGK